MQDVYLFMDDSVNTTKREITFLFLFFIEFLMSAKET